MLYTQLEGRLVSVDNISEIKSYLLKVRPNANGRSVLRYGIQTKPEPIVRQQLLMANGKTKWLFYGFLEDVIWNINKGLLESKGV